MNRLSTTLVSSSMAFMFAGCATPSGGQGGADFRSATGDQPSLPIERVYDVCWPNDAPATQKVTLAFARERVFFDVSGGASNSTGRCLREVAETWPWGQGRPNGQVELSPPRKPPTGWQVLAYVSLLSTTRFGPERGLLDPAPLVAQCIRALGSPRDSTVFELRSSETFVLRTIPEAMIDSERCVEAVLSSVAWPSTRELSLGFTDTAGSPAPVGEVSLYAADGKGGTPLSPESVSMTLKARAPAVKACLDAALVRRIVLGGGRTFRFRVEAGKVASVWVAANATDSSRAAADYLLDQCVANVIRTTPFEGTGEGVYSWVFGAR